MNHNTIETVLGGVVLLIAGIFLAFALSSASFKQTSGYTVNANFSNANGLAPGMDVRMSGVKVGSVSNMQLDPKTYLATVAMMIQPDIKLPTDTVAKIASESILGGKYLTLEPGAEDQMLKDGDRIQYTQAAVNLEEMIGKFIFDGEKDKKKDKKDGAAKTAAPDAEAQPFSSDY
ncbi:MAG TPA: outer membrane lipid asymmetry maintenance protein MlaD [Alphaproteobacteria bacterium]